MDLKQINLKCVQGSNFIKSHKNSDVFPITPHYSQQVNLLSYILSIMEILECFPVFFSTVLEKNRFANYFLESLILLGVTERQFLLP